MKRKVEGVPLALTIADELGEVVVRRKRAAGGAMASSAALVPPGESLGGGSSANGSPTSSWAERSQVPGDSCARRTRS